MILSDPIIIGYPARNAPSALGTWSDHGLPKDLLIGHTVSLDIDGRDVLFSVNISYVPDNPKRQRLVPILQPKGALPADLWEYEGFTKAEPKAAPPKQEEFPF